MADHKGMCLADFHTRSDSTGPLSTRHITIKFLNFGMTEIFAVFYLKFKYRGQTLGVFCQNDANGKAKSEDPDQTAPLRLLPNLDLDFSKRLIQRNWYAICIIVHFYT